MPIAIVNLNLDLAELQGCTRLAAALAELAGGPVATIHPWAAVRADPGLLRGADGLLLGPQGTPFSSYDADFLPWLKSLVQDAGVPVLGVCGGMQALALAFGGRLESTYGGAIGQDYTGHRKLLGPLAITLHQEALPAWLPAPSRALLRYWTEAGRHAFESHVEQVAALPEPLVRLASSEPTPIEAFAHPTLPILASQFHPELGWDQGCAAGKLWLQAWLALL